MKVLLLFLTIYSLAHASDDDWDAPMAKGLQGREIRRKPPLLLSALGPLAFGQRTGDDAKIPIQNIGTFGAGNVKNTFAKFVPEGMENEPLNGGSFQGSSHPDLGYMDRETTAGKSVGSQTHMNFQGIGKLEMNEEKEQGSGLLDFSKSLFPFLQLPPLKSQQPDDEIHTDVDPSIADTFYSHMKPYEKKSEESYSPFKPPLPFDDVQESKQENKIYEMFKKPKAMAATTRVEDTDKDLLGSSETEGFIAQGGEDKKNQGSFIEAPVKSVSAAERYSQLTGRIPIEQLGLDQKQVYDLCLKFSKVAAQHCYGPKVEEQFVLKCQGYNEDCGQFQAKYKPLGAIANSFSSGVGMTFYDWGVNGIPYYAVNQEGGIGNGHHGKADFGSWGGGYSDNLGVRDFWSQTGEYGANWYEGTYGYKTGWSIPIAQSLGVEGGAGTQVHVPVKEGEMGNPISITNGYHVGPYVGLADRVGIDWYNGGISVNKGFAIPFVGVNVNSGNSVGFPSIGHFMKRMGVNGVDYLNQMVEATRNFDAPAIAGQSTTLVHSSTNDGV